MDDIPVHLVPAHQPPTHSLYCPEEDIRLPLSLQGVISYFETRTPTPEEVESCTWVVLTDHREWDPHSDSFLEQESNAIESSYAGQQIDPQL